MSFIAKNKPSQGLREYQSFAVEKASAFLSERANQPSTLSAAQIVLPTGCGKSVIGAHLISTLPNKRVLFIVHRRELVSQFCGHLTELGIDAGVVMGGFDECDRPVTVGSVQTLSPDRLAQITKHGNIDLLIIDECHHATEQNPSYLHICEHLREINSYLKIIGFTATPVVARKKATPIFKRTIFARSIPDMIKAGWLAPMHHCRVVAPIDLAEMRSVHNPETDEDDYSLRQLAGRCIDPAVIAAVVNGTTEKIGSRPTLVFGASVEHARYLMHAYRRAGISAEMVHGSQSPGERSDIINAWKTGKIQIVTNFNVLTEGFDYPEIAALVIARPCRSRTAYLQMLGRGTRLAPTKTECVVFDLMSERPDMRQVVLSTIIPDVSRSSGEDNPSLLYFVDPRALGEWKWHQAKSKSGVKGWVAPVNVHEKIWVLPTFDNSGLAYIYISTRDGERILEHCGLQTFETTVAFEIAGRYIKARRDSTSSVKKWGHYDPTSEQINFAHKLLSELRVRGFSEVADALSEDIPTDKGGYSQLIDTCLSHLRFDFVLAWPKREGVGRVIING